MSATSMIRMRSAGWHLAKTTAVFSEPILETRVVMATIAKTESPAPARSAAKAIYPRLFKILDCQFNNKR